MALDINCPRFASIDSLLSDNPSTPARLLALDGITNPQNVGMIIRSAVAAGLDGLLYPRKGVAALGPLVIKASAGTVFRAPLILCDTLAPALEQLKTCGYKIATLEAAAPESLFSYDAQERMVFVLGGETSGVSDAVSQLARPTTSDPHEQRGRVTERCGDRRARCFSSRHKPPLKPLAVLRWYSIPVGYRQPGLLHHVGANRIGVFFAQAPRKGDHALLLQRALANDEVPGLFIGR